MNERPKTGIEIPRPSADKVDIPITPREQAKPEVDMEYDETQEIAGVDMLTPRGQYMAEVREAMEAGEYPDLIDYFAKIESEFDYEMGQDPSLALEAKKAISEFVDELKLIELEQGEEAMLQRLLQRFFVDTEYHFNRNSMLRLFTEKKPQGNCDAIAKAVAGILEKIGFDPEKDIEFQFYKGHVRVILSREGTRYVMEGPEMQKFEPEAGTTLETLRDYERRMVGMEAKVREFVEPEADYYEQQREPAVLDWLQDGLDAINRAITPPVTGLRATGAATRDNYLNFVRSLVGSYAPRRQAVYANMGALTCLTLLAGGLAWKNPDTQILEEQNPPQDIPELAEHEQQEYVQTREVNEAMTVDVMTEEQFERRAGRPKTKKRFGVGNLMEWEDRGVEVEQGVLNINVDEIKPGKTRISEGALKYLMVIILNDNPGITEVNFQGQNLSMTVAQVEEAWSEVSARHDLDLSYETVKFSLNGAELTELTAETGLVLTEAILRDPNLDPRDLMDYDYLDMDLWLFR